jgi:multiple sugar transport system permease protein
MVAQVAAPSTPVSRPGGGDRPRIRRKRPPVHPRVWHFLTFGAPGVLIYLCLMWNGTVK